MRLAGAGCLAAFLLAASPAWGWWGRDAQTIHALQAQYDAGQYESVIARLYSDRLQLLRGQSLCRGYILLGASYEKAGHPDKALSVYQVGVRLFPRDQELLTHLAQLMHQSGLDEQAKPLYEKILSVNPYNPYAHLGLAEIDRALGFLDRSIEHYEQALADLGDRGGVWLDYAGVLYEARDLRTAELAARRARDLYPEEAPVLLLALILQDLGRTQEALAEIEPLVRAGRVEALRARALWLLEIGGDAQALAAAEALLLRQPEDPLALFLRARLNLKAGRKAQALEDLRQASNQSRQSPFTARVCARLAGLLEGRP